MVFGGHGDVAAKETGEGGVVVEQVSTLGVDVDEVDAAGVVGELGFDAADKGFEDGCLKGMEEEEEGGSAGEGVVEGVLLEDLGGGEGWGGGVGGVGLLPVVEVEAGDIGHGWVEFDADDLPERKFAGDEQGAAFAAADVGEGVAVDGVGGWCRASAG